MHIHIHTHPHVHTYIHTHTHGEIDKRAYAGAHRHKQRISNQACNKGELAADSFGTSGAVYMRKREGERKRKREKVCPPYPASDKDLGNNRPMPKYNSVYMSHLHTTSTYRLLNDHIQPLRTQTITHIISLELLEYTIAYGLYHNEHWL